MSAILFGSFIFLCLLGMPIAFVLGMSSLFALLYNGNYPLTLVVQRMFTSLDGFPLMAIPFFILAGSLMEIGGISRRIVSFAFIFVGAIRGGLSIVAVLGTTIFSGVSGSSVADTAAMGTILIPRMVERGYSRKFAAGLLASTGAMGALIPPSIPVIIYGVIAGASIGDIFIASLVPGFAVGLGLILVSLYIARKEGFPAEESIDLKEAWKRTKNAILAVIMPVMILGGIKGGVFTPTEAAVVACAYAILIGGFVYKEIKLRDVPQIMKSTIVGTTVVMFLIANASLFSWILASERVPQAVAAFFLSVSSDPNVILFFIMIMLLVVGTFMDCTPALILTMPVLLPLVSSLGIDLVHFGVIVIFNLAIGLLTPPVGTCLFVACGIAKIGMAEIVKGVWPFITVMVALLLVFTYMPNLVLWLPQVMK